MSRSAIWRPIASAAAAATSATSSVNGGATKISGLGKLAPVAAARAGAASSGMMMKMGDGSSNFSGSSASFSSSLASATGNKNQAKHTGSCSCSRCVSTTTASSAALDSSKGVKKDTTKISEGRAKLHRLHQPYVEPGSEDDKADPNEDRSYLRGTDPNLGDILKANRKWVEETNAQDPNFFKQLGKGQAPKYFYIGCSDSRVDPLKLMGLDKGSVFIHRNVGNVVSPADMNCHSALEFAVEHLKVPHIIVCGHYDCGAVRASLGDQSFNKAQLPPLVEYWTRNIRDLSRLYSEQLSEIESLEERNRRLVELNVIEQCLNIFKVGMIQKKRLASSQTGHRYVLPRIHGLVFDPADGVLHKLNLNWKQDLEKMRKAFDLSDMSSKNREAIWFGDQKKMKNHQ